MLPPSTNACGCHLCLTEKAWSQISIYWHLVLTTMCLSLQHSITLTPHPVSVDKRQEKVQRFFSPSLPFLKVTANKKLLLHASLTIHKAAWHDTQSFAYETLGAEHGGCKHQPKSDCFFLESLVVYLSYQLTKKNIASLTVHFKLSFVCWRLFIYYLWSYCVSLWALLLYSSEVKSICIVLSFLFLQCKLFQSSSTDWITLLWCISLPWPISWYKILVIHHPLFC